MFVLLLAPGLTYRAYRAPSLPVRKLSALREIGGVALRSVAFDAVALAGFGLARVAVPRATPDVGALVRDQGRYLEEHYLLVTWWAFGTLGFACLASVLVAVFVSSERANSWRASDRFSWMLPRGSVTEDSAWKLTLGAYPNKRTHVGLMLDDGHFVDGTLWTFSADAEEVGDRDIALQQPRLREPGATDLKNMDEVDGIVVSARNIRAITITYYDQ